MLSLVRGIYRVTDSRPCYCYGLDPYHTEAVGDILDVPVTAAGLREGRIDDVSWLMLFPPRLVESYGREWLRSAPVYRVIDLEDGGLLLVAIADRVGTDRLLSTPAYRVERLANSAVLLAVDCGVTIDDPYEHSTEEVSAHLGIPWEPQFGITAP